MTHPLTGHDGPYDAPCRIQGGSVRADWIDYNGHMNVAYYTMAMDEAMDVFLEETLGLGPTQAKQARMGPYSLQANYRYLDELRENDGYLVDIQLLDHDAKRMHLFASLLRDDGVIAATVETLLMNVDLEKRRASTYPDWAQARLAQLQSAHNALPSPTGVGAPMGIRRQ